MRMERVKRRAREGLEKSWNRILVSFHLLLRDLARRVISEMVSVALYSTSQRGGAQLSNQVKLLMDPSNCRNSRKLILLARNSRRTTSKTPNSVKLDRCDPLDRCDTFVSSCCMSINELMLFREWINLPFFRTSSNPSNRDPFLVTT